MKFFSKIKGKLPSLKSISLALLFSIFLTLAFPNFELWFIAWFGLIPLFYAIEREKESFARSFVISWLSGTLFFFATCWWLTFAPITYGGVPVVFAYVLLLGATAVAGLYIGLFGGVFSIFLRRFGKSGIFMAPILWTAIEFVRLWTSGNSWNAIGYSQAFNSSVNFGAFGGVFFVSFCVVLVNAIFFWYFRLLQSNSNGRFSSLHPLSLADGVRKLVWNDKKLSEYEEGLFTTIFVSLPVISGFTLLWVSILMYDVGLSGKYVSSDTFVVAVQPNVPMNGLTPSRLLSLRKRQAKIAEMMIESPDFSVFARRQAETDVAANVEKRARFYEGLARESFRNGKKLVIFPESPMNFQYSSDAGFRKFIGDFTLRNNVSVLFNSAEPDKERKDGYFNSAVMVNEQGKLIAQYDKIYLLPFGEFVPLPGFLAQFVPTMVGRFSSGKEYDLFPVGETKAGVMICFESHFSSLSREYVQNGADVLIEMTNDGYLGDTPVLRQHLASSVFRAVETNRPVLRVTNVGITTYINESGQILDTANVYQEAGRVWSIYKSDGEKTIYVRFGDWFAWLCLIVSLGISFLCVWKR